MKRNIWLPLLCCFLVSCANRISLTPLPTPTLDPSTYCRIVTREPGPGTPVLNPTDTPRPRLSPYPSPTFALYTVKAGDNLKKIAKEHGTSLEALIVANDLENPDYLRTGQVLMIPPLDVTPSPRHRHAPMLAGSSLSRNRQVATISPGSTSGRRERIVYVIDKDDHYHREGCPLLGRKNPIPMTCQEAIGMGYVPCRTCNPSCQ